MRNVTLKEAKEIYKSHCQFYGSSMCEIKTLAEILEISKDEAGDILKHLFLEDAIGKYCK